jgi:phage terminase large subunit-like protein
LVAVAVSDFHIEVLGSWEAPEGDPDWRTPASDVEDAIREACERFTVRELAADPWRFEQSLLKLLEEGVPVVEFPTNSRARMNPATVGFYQAVMDGEVSHNGDLTLKRHLDNCILKESPQGAVITKEYRSSRRFIDLAVAVVIGVARARSWRDEEIVIHDDAPILAL